MHEDAQWNRASEWLSSAASSPRLTVLGAPFNRSVTPGRCDLGPDAIRAALARYSTFDFATGFDLRDLAVLDLGNLLPNDVEKGVRSTEGVVALLGGDNGLTRPGVRALGNSLSRIGLITLDAHLDLRHTNDGPMNGNPIRGLLEDGLPGKNIVQIGLQAFANSPDYARYGLEAGIRWVTAEECHTGSFSSIFQCELNRLAENVDVVALDLDLDVMDSAFAPGCPGSRPGGLTPTEVRHAARMAGRHPKVKYIDLVELDPERDEGGRTALAAAACLLEFGLGMLERP